MIMMMSDHSAHLMLQLEFLLGYIKMYISC